MIFGRQLPGYNNYIITREGGVYSLRSKKFLKPQRNSTGYLRVDLADGKSGHNWKFIHRIVAELYCYNDDPARKHEVNHNDHDISNNCFTNLSWTTPKNNIRHSRNHFITKYKKKYHHDEAKAIAGTPF
jgi:hypothetical protein